MKLTLETDSITVELTFKYDVTIDELAHAFRTLAYAATYHIDCINEYIPEPE